MGAAGRMPKPAKRNGTTLNAGACPWGIVRKAALETRVKTVRAARASTGTRAGVETVAVNASKLKRVSIKPATLPRTANARVSCNELGGACRQRNQAQRGVLRARNEGVIRGGVAERKPQLAWGLRSKNKPNHKRSRRKG